MTGAAKPETELKIPVAGLEPVRARLEAVGATCMQAAARESNTLFDDSGNALSGRGHTLRLRRFAGRTIVTHKGATTYLGSIKVRDEIEFEITDPEAFTALLAELGYTPSLHYEKDREAWQFADTSVTLDHTPMGDFVEIEGPPAAITDAAQRIGLEPDQAVRGSYIALWQRYRDDNPDLGLGADMVFPER